MATRMFSAANGRPLAVNPQLAKEAGRKPEGNPETATATERDERRRAVENDRVAMESQGGARVLTVQHWQSHDGSFDFHPAEEASGSGGGAAAAGQAGTARTGEPADGNAAEPGEGGESPAAAAQRGAAEQSLGKGYG